METETVTTPKTCAIRRGFLLGTPVKCRDGREGIVSAYNGGTLSCPSVIVKLQNDAKIARGINALEVMTEKRKQEEQTESVLLDWKRDFEGKYTFIHRLAHGSATEVWLVAKRNHTKLILKHYLLRWEAIEEHSVLKQLREKNTKFFPSCWSRLRVTPGGGRLLGFEYIKGQAFAPSSRQDLQQQLARVLQVCSG